MGDQGQTYLASGAVVPKTDGRVELYGTCDELNSVLGLAISFTARNDDRFVSFLGQIQNLLFEIGSELAGYIPKDSKNKVEPESIIAGTDIQDLEVEIDRLTESLPPLKSFILPGGSSPSSALHLARTVCRRLERDVLKYTTLGGNVSEPIRIYLNRLSDYLFTAARYANFLDKNKEVEWKSRTK